MYDKVNTRHLHLNLLGKVINYIKTVYPNRGYLTKSDKMREKVLYGMVGKISMKDLLELGTRYGVLEAGGRGRYYYENGSDSDLNNRRIA